MRDSFTHKLIMTVLAAFVAAGMMYLYRHVVVSAIHETSDEGWRQMDAERAAAKAKARR
jgi:zinc transporter ZupT